MQRRFSVSNQNGFRFFFLCQQEVFTVLELRYTKKSIPLTIVKDISGILARQIVMILRYVYNGRLHLLKMYLLLTKGKKKKPQMQLILHTTKNQNSEESVSCKIVIYVTRLHVFYVHVRIFRHHEVYFTFLGKRGHMCSCCILQLFPAVIITLI